MVRSPSLKPKKRRQLIEVHHDSEIDSKISILYFALLETAVVVKHLWLGLEPNEQSTSAPDL